MGHFETWVSLHDAFLAHFSPNSCEDILYEKLPFLVKLQMANGERIDSYHGCLEIFLLHLSNHEIPYAHIMK